MSVGAERRCEAASQAKICYLDCVRGSIIEDVLWLQVAM